MRKREISIFDVISIMSAIDRLPCLPQLKSIFLGVCIYTYIYTHFFYIFLSFSFFFLQMKNSMYTYICIYLSFSVHKLGSYPFSRRRTSESTTCFFSDTVSMHISPSVYRKLTYKKENEEKKEEKLKKNHNGSNVRVTSLKKEYMCIVIARSYMYIYLYVCYTFTRELIACFLSISSYHRFLYMYMYIWFTWQMQVRFFHFPIYQ